MRLSKLIALLSNTLGHLSALLRSGSRILIPLPRLCFPPDAIGVSGQMNSVFQASSLTSCDEKRLGLRARAYGQVSLA